MIGSIIMSILIFIFPFALLALGIQIAVEDNKRIKREEQQRMKEAYKQAIRELEEEENN